ncbi:transposase [Flavobacterium hauense]
MERKVKYNYEFKLCCIEEVLKHHCSAESVAYEHGFTKSNLRHWIGFYSK